MSPAREPGAHTTAGAEEVQFSEKSNYGNNLCQTYKVSWNVAGNIVALTAHCGESGHLALVCFKLRIYLPSTQRSRRKTKNLTFP